MELKDFRSQVLVRATQSDDVETIRTALQAVRLIDSIEDESGNRAKPESRWSKFIKWAGERSALLAVIITAVTLLAQILQFGLTGCSQRRSNEESQWRAAVRTVSFSDAGNPLAGALNAETFYDSSRYGDRARALVAASLPYVQESSAFDTILFNLERHLRPGDEGYLYGVAKGLAGRERELYRIAPSMGIESLTHPDSCPSEMSEILASCFRKKISEVVVDATSFTDDRRKKADMWSAKAKVLDWEIDSATNGIVDYWNAHLHISTNGMSPASGPLGGRTPDKDFRGLVLRFDNDSFSEPLLTGHDGNAIELKDVDLSLSYMNNSYLSHLRLMGGTTLRGANLSGADLSWSDFGSADMTSTNLDGARIEHADLSHVTSFQGSTWACVKVEGAALSPQLRDYISATRGGKISLDAQGCSAASNHR